MSCEKCRAAAAHANVSERAKAFRQATVPLCGCEQYSVSDYSPGPVKDEEALWMILSDPQSLVDGWLHPSKIQTVHRGGQSVLRDAAGDREFEITMDELMSRSDATNFDRYFFGALKFSASEVRYCGPDRLLCIFDTAEREKPNHADLVAPPVFAVSNSKRRQAEMEYAREVIIALGRKLAKPHDFRSGLLKKYARPS